MPTTISGTSLQVGSIDLTTPLATADGGTGLTSHPLGLVFTSAEQTLAAAGQLTLAHSLGAVPALIFGYLICKTAENGYSINDTLVVPVHQISNNADDSYGLSCTFDTTNINIRFGTGVPSGNIFPINHKTTGTGTNATNANWKLIVRAWA